jgi:hypothetical protein
MQRAHAGGCGRRVVGLGNVNTGAKLQSKHASTHSHNRKHTALPTPHHLSLQPYIK